MMFSLVVFAYPWFAFQFLLFEINMDFHILLSSDTNHKKANHSNETRPHPGTVVHLCAAHTGTHQST